MSALLKYLNDNHKTTKKVVEDFASFGVNVKQEGEYFLFKYDMIDVKWTTVSKECRGHIIQFTDLAIGGKGWVMRANPWDKFFNRSEGKCPLFDKEEFEKNIPILRFSEKKDGSAIVLWYDGTTWRISTLGSITTGQVGYISTTFEDLFWKTADKEKVLNKTNTAFTYLFELCCAENRIVTSYLTNNVTLLSIRSNNYGFYLDEGEVDVIAEKMGVLVPDRISLPFTTLEECEHWVEIQSLDKKYGDCPEGWVGYLNNVPIFKMKNESYTLLHRSVSNMSHNVVIESIFTEKWDDIQKYAPTFLVEFAEKVKAEYSKNIVYLTTVFPSFDRTFESQKELALFIQKEVNKKFHAYFFQCKNDWNINSATCWMKTNWKKFEDDYKKLI